LRLGIAAVGIGIAVASVDFAHADTYRYDALSRLIRVQYTNGSVIEYSYDAAGNRLSMLITVNAAPPPTLVSAASRKTHGAAGTFDLPLSLTSTNPTTEPRSGGAGGNHTIVFTFDKPVTAGNASVVAGAGTAGVPTFSGNEMRVSISGVTNQQYVTVAVSDVVATDGGVGGSGSVRTGFLLGDVSQNRVVTVSDLAQVNAQIAQLVTTANYLKDVNATGTLSVADKGIANTQITKALPAP
jgi:YD repeat-containing protein